MPIMNTLQNKSSKIILILGIFAGLIGIVYVIPSISADDGMNVSSDLSTKIHIGKSNVDENSTDTNLSGQSGSNMDLNSNSDSEANASIATKSQDTSHENSHAISDESESGHYKNAYEKISANSDDEFIVQSQRHLYKSGDNVTIQGSLWSNLVNTGNVTTLLIQVKDNDGNVIYAGKAPVDANSEFSAEFQLPSDAKKGAYVVDVKADVSVDVLNNLSIKTKDNMESSTKIAVVSPNAISVNAKGHDFDLQVASNSTSITNLNFDEQNRKLSFTVQGDAGTRGVTEITIPKSLLSGDLTVMIDGKTMTQSDVVETASTDTATTLELNYHHSTHQIDIIGTNTVPEFGTFASMVFIVSVLTIIVLSSQIRRIL